METAIDALRRLHDHRRWARERTLVLVRPLDEPTRRRVFAMGLGSIMGTLAHLYGAEVVWLSVLEGGEPGMNLPGADAFASLGEPESTWREVDARWERYWSTLTLERLDEPAVRRRGDRDFITSTAEVLMHVCTHQHYHLAQIINMLKQCGALPEPLPSIDFITMAREQWSERG